MSSGDAPLPALDVLPEMGMFALTAIRREAPDQPCDGCERPTFALFVSRHLTDPNKEIIHRVCARCIIPAISAWLEWLAIFQGKEK